VSLGRRALVVALICATSAGWLGGPPAPVAAAARPNIVVFYLDDVAAHDGRLWSDPQRTPAIYDTFIAHGTRFTHAFGEDPLCCPARATILSGLHTHNNGVNVNDARLFLPQESVAGELTRAGYTTMWIGKYMNRNSWLSDTGWAAHMAQWSVFDGIFGLNGGAYYDYKIRTKDHGDIAYTDVHSTRMVADRTVSRFAAAPADKPIFAMLSIYDLHAPNISEPVTQQQAARCDGLDPWWTPAYNEADVSDKPAYIQALPLQPYADGWPMAAFCRQMYGVDDVVQRVTDELAAEGRLNNTLLVFTADNGMSWGAHRRGQQKNTPDATAVPLYMAWPAGWGTAPRVVNEYVSNIDLAPTFCQLGGCTLGPYPSGQDEADGRSLVALLGQGTSLGRDAILEQSPVGEPAQDIPGWTTIRTTPQSGLGLWRFTQYANGERELYDQVNDPYELNNLASQPGRTALVAALSQRLLQLLGEGRVNRPDLSLFGKKQKLYRVYGGYNLFASSPTPVQTLPLKVVRSKTYLLLVNVRNNKVASDSFRVTASIAGSPRVKITWLLDGVDVTAQMNSGGIPIGSVAGSMTRSLTLKIVIKSTFKKTDQTNVDIDVESTSDTTQDDHMTLILRR
jgi:arylsulfatase A-like enzyme